MSLARRISEYTVEIFSFVNDWPWEIQACVRLFIAALLGSLVGLEREHHGRSAGFRTQLLVCLGSALAMVVSLHFDFAFGSRTSEQAIRIDPARLAYGVMGGIGFLGAGTIIKHGVNIRGMTTAASLWCTAALGLACGFGMYTVALFSTLLILFALMGLATVDKIVPGRWYKTVTIFVKSSQRDNVTFFRDELCKREGVKIIDVEYSQDRTQGLEVITFLFSVRSKVRPTHLDWFATHPEIIKFNVKQGLASGSGDL